MRALIATVALLSATSMPGAHNQGEAPAASREAPNRSDVMADALWRLAVATRTPMGFQAAERTRMPSALRDRPEPDSRSVTDALDSLVAADDRYSWHTMNGIVVVRPNGAWQDARDPLNTAVRHFEVRQVASSVVLRSLHDFFVNGRLVVNPALSGDITLDVRAGTVLDVLNKLLVARADQTMWVASFDEGERNWSLEVRNAVYLTGLVSSRSPVAR